MALLWSEKASIQNTMMGSLACMKPWLDSNKTWSKDGEFVLNKLLFRSPGGNIDQPADHHKNLPLFKSDSFLDSAYDTHDEENADHNPGNHDEIHCGISKETWDTFQTSWLVFF